MLSNLLEIIIHELGIPTTRMEWECHMFANIFPVYSLFFIQLKNGNPLRPANMARWKSPNSIRIFAGQQKSTNLRIRNAKQLTPYRKHTSFKMVWRCTTIGLLVPAFCWKNPKVSHCWKALGRCLSSWVGPDMLHDTWTGQGKTDGCFSTLSFLDHKYKPHISGDILSIRGLIPWILFTYWLHLSPK